jgi:SnoaL-like domain
MDDLAAIQQLYAHYAWMLDEGRYDDWLECFTEDAVVEGPTFGRHSGREELRHFLAKYKAETGMFKVRHVVSTVTAEIEGDHATGACYVLYYRTYRGRTELSSIGGFRDHLRKVNGRWLFVDRQAFWDYSGRSAFQAAKRD